MYINHSHNFNANNDVENLNLENASDVCAAIKSKADREKQRIIKRYIQLVYENNGKACLAGPFRMHHFGSYDSLGNTLHYYIPTNINYMPQEIQLELVKLGFKIIKESNEYVVGYEKEYIMVEKPCGFLGLKSRMEQKGTRFKEIKGMLDTYYLVAECDCGT